MYLQQTDIYADDGVADFYQNGFLQRFFSEAYHISWYFDNLVYRKIKNDVVNKVCLYLCPKRPEKGKYEKTYPAGIFNEDKYRLLINVLCVNAFLILIKGLSSLKGRRSIFKRV